MTTNLSRSRFAVALAAVCVAAAGCASSSDDGSPGASSPAASSTSSAADTQRAAAGDDSAEESQAATTEAPQAAAPADSDTTIAATVSTTTTTTTTTTLAPPAESPFERTTHVLDIPSTSPPTGFGLGVMAAIGERFTLHADSYVLPNASFEQFIQRFATGYTGTTSMSEQMMGTVTFDGTEQALAAAVQSTITLFFPSGEWSSATDTWHELITIRSDIPATTHVLVHEAGRITFAVQATEQPSVYRYAVQVITSLHDATLEMVGPPPEATSALDTVRATGIVPDTYQLQIRAQPDDDGVWHTWSSVWLNQLYEGPTIAEVSDTLSSLGWQPQDVPTQPDELKMYDPATGDSYVLYDADGTDGGLSYDTRGVEIAPLIRSS